MSAESNASTSNIDCGCLVVVHASMVHKVAKPSNGPPKIFRVTKGVLPHPILGQMHPLSPKLNLLVCRISGRGLLSETFRETLPTLSCGRGEKEHRNNITCTSGSGTGFVFKGKLIQCRPVNEVLSFLYDLFTKGLSYSAVNPARSALSNYFMGENLSDSEFSVASHPLIKRYIKGLFDSRSPSPRYSEIWDV